MLIFSFSLTVKTDYLTCGIDSAFKCDYMAGSRPNGAKEIVKLLALEKRRFIVKIK